MYRICGTGYCGVRAMPLAVDYTVLAASSNGALEKLRQLGIAMVHYTVVLVR
jgi:hypothetical protein